MARIRHIENQQRVSTSARRSTEDVVPDVARSTCAQEVREGCRLGRGRRDDVGEDAIKCQQ